MQYPRNILQPVIWADKTLRLPEKRIPILPIVLLLLGAAAVFASRGATAFAREAGDGTGTPSPLARMLEWRDPEGTLRAQALVLTEWTDREVVTRVLIEPVAGRRFVLDQIRQPLEGVTTQRIFAEATGWRLEAVESTNLRLEEMSELVRPEAVAARFMAERRTLRLSLETNGGFSYESPTLAWTSSTYSEIFDHLSASAQGGRLTSGMPPEVASGLRALHALNQSALRDGSFEEFAPVLTVLVDLLDTCQSPRELRQAREIADGILTWTMAFGSSHPRAQIANGEQQRFASRFLSIDTARPLAGILPEAP